jgi:hypothetical protein
VRHWTTLDKLSNEVIESVQRMTSILPVAFRKTSECLSTATCSKAISDNTCTMIRKKEVRHLYVIFGEAAVKVGSISRLKIPHTRLVIRISRDVSRPDRPENGVMA